MGCNCKNITKFQKEHSNIDNVNLISKLKGFVKRMLLSLVMIPIMILTVPIIIIILSFQLLFGKTMGIKIPSKLLGKQR